MTIFSRDFEQLETKLPRYKKDKKETKIADKKETVVEFKKVDVYNDSDSDSDEIMPEVKKYQIQLIRHSVIDVHKKKVKCLAIHHR